MLDFASWFSGFIDGEGCFLIDKTDNGYRCRLSIKLRVDDKEIIERIYDYFGVGHIHCLPPYGDDRANNPTVTLHIDANDDVQRLVEHFDEYPLQAKKKRDYRIWRRAAIELRKPRSSRSMQLFELLKEQLSLIKKYDSVAFELATLEDELQMKLL